MNKSTQYQIQLKKELSRFYASVLKEYHIPKDATDEFEKAHNSYIPRLDLAVGPFNNTPGNKFTMIMTEYESKTPKNLFDTTGLRRNPNPRCTLAIEVVYSGTSKHVLGDMINAGTLGLYGIVLASDEMYAKVTRIGKYIEIIKHLDKTTEAFCSNVTILKASEFIRKLRSIPNPQ